MKTKLFFYPLLALLFIGLSACAGPRHFVRKAPEPQDIPKRSAFTTPLPGSKIISNFGPRGKRFHEGIDLKKSKSGGEAVLAARAGTVKMAGKMSGYGRMVLIQHADGSRTRYGHLKKMYVEKGEKVKAGQKIGTVGSSGRSSTPHLHYEVITRSGISIDPKPYLR